MDEKIMEELRGLNEQELRHQLAEVIEINTVLTKTLQSRVGKPRMVLNEIKQHYNTFEELGIDESTLPEPIQDMIGVIRFWIRTEE